MPTFLLTRPSRGATPSPSLHLPSSQNFYSHAPRGARPVKFIKESRLWEAISTHTPLAGRDSAVCLSTCSEINFYSHAPRGARRKTPQSHTKNIKFLLTRPSRGATAGIIACTTSVIFLLTRPSRGATHSICRHSRRLVISTHTPLAGRDRFRPGKSTCPSISTHTPLAGRDPPA